MEEWYVCIYMYLFSGLTLVQKWCYHTWLSFCIFKMMNEILYIYIYDWLNINKFLRVYCLVNHYIPSRDKRTKQKYKFKTSIPDSSIRQQAFSKVWIKELKVLNLGEHLVALGRRSYDQTARCLENLWETHPSCSFDVVYCETFGLRGS